MAKETVRYPDALVARVESVVAEVEAFESKSEFYRFASDFLLSVVDPEHDPTVLGYGDILTELESNTEARLDRGAGRGTEATTGPFLDAYIQVRRHLLYDDVEAARAVVTERYDATDREALLLDEVIGRERRSSVVDRTGSRQPGTAPRDHVRRPAASSEPSEERRADPGRDGGDEDQGGTPEAATDGEPTDEFGDAASGHETRRRRAEATRETDGGVDPVADTEDG